MFIKIPFESVIDFKKTIKEITSISLEHDFNLNDDVVLGNFYVEGTFRSHELSINTEDFKYTLPFTVAIRDDIEKDTLEFNIEDFTYEILEDKKLQVNIEYSLEAEFHEKEVIFEPVKEEELESELAYIDDFLENNSKDNNERSEVVDVVEEKVEQEEVVDVPVEVEEERVDENTTKTVMDTIKSSDDTFVTYHIHIFKEDEKIESIMSSYHVTKEVLMEYNDLDHIEIGDKILIPKVDE